MSVSLINIAYDISKKEYQNKDFTFNDLWKKVIKFAHLNSDESLEEIGNFYSDIMQDPRFIYTGNNKWQLKEYVSLSEIDKMQSRMYDFNDVQVVDESVIETDKYSSKVVSEEELLGTDGYSDIDEDYEEIQSNLSSSDEEDEEE